ncbi:heat repeat protein [Oceanobacillus picturae]|uniref:Heat repeat protein n=1 Tax=Oceanobacillus picturae TaxID=171693 RepID=A0A0U9H8A1_9BACI|nr:hypothetical protein [Oceanobacillus picturae]GAQ18009.1 heat repeat protein [Oceanobacillus picturae]
MDNSNYVDYEDLKTSLKHKSEYIRELQQENKRYREALEFIANVEYGEEEGLIRTMDEVNYTANKALDVNANE